MTDVTQEARLLKETAHANYEVDGGEMFDCFAAADYVRAIEKYRSAASAWKAHLIGLAARYDVRQYREAA